MDKRKNNIWPKKTVDLVDYSVPLKDIPREGFTIVTKKLDPRAARLGREFLRLDGVTYHRRQIVCEREC